MAEQEAEREKNLGTPLDFDPMSSSSNGEEERSDSGYVSFPQRQQQQQQHRRGSSSGVGTDITGHSNTTTHNNKLSHQKSGTSFDPFAANTSARFGATTSAAITDGEELLVFDSTSTSVTSATSPSKLSTKIPAPNSLFDDDDSTVAMSVELPTISSVDDAPSESSTRASASVVPGAAGYLEMEEEPPRDVFRNNGDSASLSEPIKTDSGLLLTHRKASASAIHRSQSQQQQPHKRTFRNTQEDFFEVENGFFHAQNQDIDRFHSRAASVAAYGGLGNGRVPPGAGKHSMVMIRARRLMSFVKIWMVVFALVLLVMTGALLHSFGHKEDLSVVQSKSATSRADVLLPDYTLDAPEEILLLPLNDVSQLAVSRNSQLHRNLQQVDRIQLQPLHQPPSEFGPERFLRNLRHEFEEWVVEHNKSYHSNEEKEKRFSIWSHNHHRTVEKNERHGPCKMTKQNVFGSNHFKDLTQEEFQSKFLTGYKGLFAEELELRKKETPEGLRQLKKDSGVLLDPKVHKVNFHESVRQRMLMHNPQVMRADARQGSSPNCKWYDMSCVLRWIWKSTGIQFGTLVGTMEPKYDSDAYPNGIDWRDSGAVTDVRTQGECGACWAVTAVETVESAVFLATGTLYELSESEIIACDDSCEMCSGGWPQNAYEWVMDHGGLPLLESYPYDADTLKALTDGLEGESDYYDESDLESYREGMCPTDDDDSKSQDSNDNSYWEGGKDNENYGDYSDQGRYGNIKGYGYATERCVCYTDGSGCDCDDQDEDTAVRNIASYGPAVVCLDASLWQDYNGGIMTADTGCSSEFLDMNHCVQVVGYAFTTNADCGEEGCDDEQDNEGSGSGSGSNSNSGSGDSAQRQGYWIIRNQWGENWGLSGYVWLAMGENTCGVLNDMTLAYV